MNRSTFQTKHAQNTPFLLTNQVKRKHNLNQIGKHSRARNTTAIYQSLVHITPLRCSPPLIDGSTR